MLWLKLFPSVLGWLRPPGFHVQTLQGLLADSWMSCGRTQRCTAVNSQALLNLEVPARLFLQCSFPDSFLIGGKVIKLLKMGKGISICCFSFLVVSLLSTWTGFLIQSNDSDSHTPNFPSGPYFLSRLHTYLPHTWGSPWKCVGSSNSKYSKLN